MIVKASYKLEAPISIFSHGCIFRILILTFSIFPSSSFLPFYLRHTPQHGFYRRYPTRYPPPMRPHSWVTAPFLFCSGKKELTSSRFWGSPKDLQVMAQTLQNKDPTVHILIAKSNNGNLTYDGIDIGGERICKEIEEEISKLSEEEKVITKLSLVGYSLGGLIARYTAGLLYSKGFFKTIKPMV